MESRYRHELKYPIELPEYYALRSRLRTVLQPDIHADAAGGYWIHSIYFDTPGDRALQEKQDGFSQREKWRIRYYNEDLSYLTLEKKQKNRDLSLKLDAGITAEQCRALLAGELDWMQAHDSPLVRELYFKMHTQLLTPKVLVSYRREAFIYGPGNVRITFDSRIRSSLRRDDFLRPTAADFDAGDKPGAMLLEVKYDGFLPAAIQTILQQDLRQQAFSKYAASRRFG